jgi:hypothetical protein
MKFYKRREDLYNDFCPGQIGAEVGVQKGDNAKSLLDAGTLELSLIDSWKHVTEGDYTRDPANIPQRDQDWLFGAVLERFKAETQSGRVSIHRLPSLQAAPLFGDNSLDYCLIDSDHTYSAVLADLKAWEHAVNETGVFMLHDFDTSPKSLEMGFAVFDAVLEFCEDRRWKPIALSMENWNTIALQRR